MVGANIAGFLKVADAMLGPRNRLLILQDTQGPEQIRGPFSVYSFAAQKLEICWRGEEFPWRE